MEEAIGRVTLRKFPELAARLHLPILARVVAISDPPQQPELAEEFRPRYAVDVQVLTEQGVVDESLPVFRSVPLPLHCSGSERGGFGFPQPGTVVELAFAFGLPSQPFIRTVLSRGISVPALDREELLWQQSETVRQQADAAGNWNRETHGDIREDSLRRLLQAAEHLAEYGYEHKQIREHSIEEIAGAKIIEALGALRLLSGGSANLSALDNLNLTTAADINSTAGRDQGAWVGNDLQEVVGNARESVAKILQSVAVEDGGKVWLGSQSVNVLQVLLDLIGVVSALAGTLQNHTHPSVGAPPSQAGAIGGHKGDADGLSGDLGPVVA